MKFKANFKWQNNLPRLQNRVDRSMGRPLAAAGNYIRRIMKKMIKRSSDVTYPTARTGSAPYSHGPRHLLWNSILFDVDNDTHSVAVGSDYDIVGLGGMFMEHGGIRNVLNKRERPDGGMLTAIFPKHPFAQPALNAALPYIPQEFRNII